MQIVISTLILISFLIILVGIIGYLLDNSRTKEISVNLSAPLKQVWNIVTSPGEQADWRSDIEKVKIEQKDERAIVWTEYRDSGSPITFKEKERVKDTKYSIEIISQSGFSGYSTIKFKPTEGGTNIRFIEVSNVPNPYLRILSYVFYHPKERMRVYINDLKAVLNHS